MGLEKCKSETLPVENALIKLLFPKGCGSEVCYCHSPFQFLLQPWHLHEQDTPMLTTVIFPVSGNKGKV